MGSWIQCRSGSQFSRHQLGVLQFSSILSWLRGKESTCQCRRLKRQGFNPWVRKSPWSGKWQLTPVFSPGNFHGQRSLLSMGSQRVGSDWAHTHTERQNSLKLFIKENFLGFIPWVGRTEGKFGIWEHASFLNCLIKKEMFLLIDTKDIRERENIFDGDNDVILSVECEEMLLCLE